MKEEILSIASELREGSMTTNEARTQLLRLFSVVEQSEQLSFTDGTMPPMGSQEFRCYHGLCECKQNCKT